MLPPANLKPHPALANTPQVAAADLKQPYNPNAIINALDTYIFSKDLIRKNTAEYCRLRDLRHFINEYITVARKGKLPVKRNTNLRSHLTEPASRHHLLPGGVGEITNMKRRIWQRCR